MSKASMGCPPLSYPPSGFTSWRGEEYKLGVGGLEGFSVKEEWENSACGQHLRKELGRGTEREALGWEPVDSTRVRDGLTKEWKLNT